jgi:nucleoside-diphosphate-sugar epimerase
MSGDAADPEFARQAAQGAQVIYQALNPPYHKWPELFPPLQRSVIGAAASAGAKLVTLENTYMYGDLHGKPMTEDLPYAAQTRKGKVRALMAEELLSAHQSGEVKAVIARASDYFGPRAIEGSMIGGRAIWPALEGKPAQMLFSPDQPHTYTFVPDIGRALALLGERDEALGQVWHIPNPETLTTRAILEKVFEEAGGEYKVSVMPKFMFKALGLFMPSLREIGEMLYEFEAPFYVDHSKFDAAFGESFKPTPMDDAIRETVAWFRANPKAN